MSEQQTSLDFEALPAGLSPKELQVALVLRNNHDKNHPVSRMKLRVLTSLPDRDVRRIIANLVNEHHLPIGSTTRPKHSGYFWITTRDELEVEAKKLASYIIDIAKRKRALEKIALDQFGSADLFADLETET